MEWYHIILIIVVLGLRIYAYATGNTAYLERQKRRRQNKRLIGIWGILLGLAIFGIAMLFKTGDI